LILRFKPRNRRCDFETQITKPELPVLRPKPKNLSTLVLKPNQETRAPRLYVHGTDRTRRHLASRLSDHRAPDLCLTILGHYTRSPTLAMILVAAHHVTPVTYTPKDKQTRFSTCTKIKVKTTEMFRIQIQTIACQ
jgi:hypothetical protein